MAAAAPFAMKVAPYAIAAAGALLGRKQSGPSAQQTAANTAGQQAGAQVGAMAPPLMATGQQLTTQGQGMLQQGSGMLRQGAQNLAPAAQYYHNILGSRQAATQSMSPETSTALEYYRGAEGKAKRTLQGGARDQAVAELDRQKVGQIAGYLPAARRSAAEGATGVGSAYGNLGAGMGNLGGTAIYGGAAATQGGVNAASTNAYIQSGLFDQATRIKEQQQKGGNTWGSFLYDIAKSIPWGGGAGKGKTLTNQYGTPPAWSITPAGNFPNPNVSGRL